MNTIQDIQAKARQNFSWRIIGENFVFKEGSHYYKMPWIVGKNIFYKEIDSHKKAQENFELIKKYFGKIFTIAETDILKNTDGHYIIKQKEIHGEKLNRKHLEENVHLLGKFRKLIIINEIIWEKEWVCLDILGSDFVSNPNSIPNIMTDGDELFLFDFWLLEKKPKNKLFEIISNIARFVQNFVITHFFVKGK